MMQGEAQGDHASLKNQVALFGNHTVLAGKMRAVRCAFDLFYSRK